MVLKEEVIQNVKNSGFDPEEEQSLIQEIEEIFAFEDSLENQRIIPKGFSS